jgi:hypothetical protein
MKIILISDRLVSLITSAKINEKETFAFPSELPLAILHTPFLLVLIYYMYKDFTANRA